MRKRSIFAECIGEKKDKIPPACFYAIEAKFCICIKFLWVDWVLCQQSSSSQRLRNHVWLAFFCFATVSCLARAFFHPLKLIFRPPPNPPFNSQLLLLMVVNGKEIRIWRFFLRNFLHHRFIIFQQYNSTLAFYSDTMAPHISSAFEGKKKVSWNFFRVGAIRQIFSLVVVMWIIKMAFLFWMLILILFSVILSLCLSQQCCLFTLIFHECY